MTNVQRKTNSSFTIKRITWAFAYVSAIGLLTIAPFLPTLGTAEEAAIEANNSRVYADIHYRKTCDVSEPYGKKIAQNVANSLKFRR